MELVQVTRDAPPPSSLRAPGEIWLDGNAILCACPDCRAPMSVRFWLMMADCWRCGTTIELSEEQERQVEQLLTERQPPPTSPPAPPPQPPPRPPEVEPILVPETPEASLLAANEQREIYREPWLRHLVNETPAWLISMLVHLIVFTLLALVTMEEKPRQGPFITLSAVLSRKVADGGDTIRIRPSELAQFDLPLPSKADLSDARQRRALLAAAQDARELRLNDDAPNLPDLRTVKGRVGRADGIQSALLARDPRLRAEIVTQEGGTTLTEAAVARGLRWLAYHQNIDGSWSLGDFRHAGDCNCSGEGNVRTKSPGTALALLPFLGAGQTHLAGKYKGTVSRGLRWLIEHQKDSGDLRHDATGNEGMYAHGQAAIVICEAFAMTGDEALRVPAQKSVNFIVEAQYHDGGWRYRPSPRNQRSDTSVVGWQLMALQSARAAGLTVPEETWEMADVYLDSVQQRDGALYSYQTNNRPTAAMTAEALLCRMYLGWKNDRPGLVHGVRWLSENHMPSASNPNIYYWYYATQVMHHHGGPEWDEWNQRMRDILVASQETQGHAAGSWRPRGEFSSEGGRIYMTSLAVCTLEVYYRHLPIFRGIELGE
jgi:Squalene-hopene cyclase C-terminal domain